MWINYLNPTHSSAAVTSGTNSTYHTLSGQANQILMCTTSTGNHFYFSFDTTAALAAPCTNTAMLSPGNYPLLLNVNHPAFVNIQGATTGYVYITEFI